MYSSVPLHMDEQKQDDKLEPTYSRSLQDVVLKTCQKQWMIEKGGKGYPCWWCDMMMMSAG